ncbi:hypothetical protein V6Z11_D03G058200 [Gossypium hirsutum]
MEPLLCRFILSTIPFDSLLPPTSQLTKEIHFAAFTNPRSNPN